MEETHCFGSSANGEAQQQKKIKDVSFFPSDRVDGPEGEKSIEASKEKHNLERYKSSTR